MRIYFVDYENVKNGGMKGLEKLTKKDVVYLNPLAQKKEKIFIIC